jgi:hypothetical protein
LLMPNSKYLTHGISNLVSLITKTKLGLSTAGVRRARQEAGGGSGRRGGERLRVRREREGYGL